MMMIMVSLLAMVRGLRWRSDNGEYDDEQLTVVVVGGETDGRSYPR